MCAELEERMLGWQRGSKNNLRKASRWHVWKKDNIHASAQLTIKPNYLWIGLMGHMLGSKRPRSGSDLSSCARVCVCVCLWFWSTCPWPKDSTVRFDATSWLGATVSIKLTYFDFKMIQLKPWENVFWIDCLSVCRMLAAISADALFHSVGEQAASRTCCCEG